MNRIQREFILFSNGNGEAAIIVREQSSVANNPVVLVTNNKAVLHRNGSSRIDLGVIDKDILDIFSTKRTVLVAEVPDDIFEVSKEKFPTDDETIDCYEACIKEVRECDSSEKASYYIMIPEGKQGMILITSQQGDVKHPVVLFDKNNVIVRRSDSMCIDFGTVDQAVIRDFTVRKKIIIAEVSESVFAQAKTNPPKETDFTACYEARIFEVGNVEKEKQTGRNAMRTFLYKFGIAMVFLFAVGFGLNQIVPGSSSYGVISGSEKGKQFLQENTVTCEINNTVKVYFADIHRGNIQYDFFNKQTQKKERMSDELVKSLELKPLFTMWARYGLLCIIGGVLIVALLFTLFSQNLFYRLMSLAEAIVD